MIKISKKISLVAVLFLLLTAIVYAGYCEYKCVHCSMVVIAGCSSAPSSYGYCPKAPDKMHAFMFVRQNP